MEELEKMLIGKEFRTRLGKIEKVERLYEDGVIVIREGRVARIPFISFEKGIVRATDPQIHERLAARGRKQMPERVEPSRRIRDRSVYYVFQGAEYFNELGQGYLWAAKRNSTGGEAPFHWRNLTRLKEGDIILHGVWQGVVCVSLVTREHYDWVRPGESRVGWRVDCKGYLLKEHPVVLSGYREQIISYCSQFTHQPFNRNGTGNQGYLYELNMPLARLFLEDVMRNNPSILGEFPGFREAMKELGY